MEEVKHRRSILSLKSLKRRLSQQLRLIDSSSARLSSLNEHRTDPSPDHQLLANNFTNLQLNQNCQEVRFRQKRHQDLRKRLSLPPETQLPEDFLLRQAHTPTLNGVINRQLRRASLSEIGFGKLESYRKLSKIGSGTYATVFRGESLLTESIVALKEIRLEHEEGTPCTAIREVSILRDLKHANIVTLHDTIHTDTSLTLVFEYVEQDLKQYMEKYSNSLTPFNVKLLLYQLLRGLAYCHHRRVLHRDLKPQNLLITDKGELKLGDFGLARAKSIPIKTYSNEVITLWYRPPDILLGSTDYYCHIDIWGVACIFFEMSCGRPIFPGTTVEHQLELIFKLLGKPNPQNWPGIDRNKTFNSFHFEDCKTSLFLRTPRFDIDGFNLLQRLFEYNIVTRISAAKALRHDFFADLPACISKLRDDENIFDSTGLKMEDNLTRLKPLKQRRQSLLI